jgi:predicted RNase H-like HicB family nuclease
MFGRSEARRDGSKLCKSVLKDYSFQMKFWTTLDRDEDGAWIAECPSIPGCVSQGSTRDEAVANIREAIAACLEVRAERGMPLTVETQLVEVGV